MGNEREKAKLDDQTKDVKAGPDHAPRAPVKDIAGQDDRLGGLAKSSEGARAGDAEPTETATRQIDDSLHNVIQSFHWLNDAAQDKVDKLRSEIKKSDRSPWIEQVAEAVLNVALGGGAAAGAKMIAGALVGGSGIDHEFVKGLFKEGISNGVKAGKEKLRGGNDGNVTDPFIDSQKEGVRGMHMENQSHFIHVGRHQVKTPEQAAALEAACSSSNVELAAVQQANATRDAWVSYLAQGKYGSVGKRGPDGSIIGESTTNMMPQERRDWVNKGVPDSVPDHAPEATDAIRGNAPGVLFVAARLPNISNNKMDGKPEVEKAIMNGVNEEIRSHYTGNVDTLKIPRQIIGNSDGHFPRFTINLDENGATGSIGHEESAWLRARATVGRPESHDKDNFDKRTEGLGLLLGELNLNKPPRGSL